MWDVESIVGKYKGMFTEGEEQKFEMNILGYNPETGLFVAKGEDYFGKSAIIGLIHNEEIKFEKYYSRNGDSSIFDIEGKTIQNRNLSEDSKNLRKIDYAGNISMFRDLTFSGSWFHKNYENLGGIWRLFSQKK